MLITKSLNIIALLSLVAAIGCTKPKQTTAVGAAAGGAIGAGLGAIIGNQTGNAGSGVAIGAVAGAATGALVANALQAQQESLRSQNEAIERQERLLQVQRSELAELRTINPDTSINSDLVEKKRIALQRRGPEPTYYRSAALRLSSPLPSSQEVRARYNPRHIPSRSLHSPSPAKVVTTSKLREPRSPAPPAVIPARIESKPRPKVPLAPQVIEPKLEDALEDTTEETADYASLNSSSSESACLDASSEQRAAASATDSADKLLHLRKALRLCPASAELHHELGKVYSAMNRSTDATYEFKEALKVDPSFSAAQAALDELKSADIDQRF